MINLQSNEMSDVFGIGRMGVQVHMYVLMKCDCTVDDLNYEFVFQRRHRYHRPMQFRIGGHGEFFFSNFPNSQGGTVGF